MDRPERGVAGPGWVVRRGAGRVRHRRHVGDSGAGGEDDDAVVVRAVSADGSAYVLRLSPPGRTSDLVVADHLAASGVPGVPPPLRGKSGVPWTTDGDTRISVTPWISGRRGVDGGLVADQWRSFGALLAAVHATPVDSPVLSAVPREDYLTATAATVRDLDERFRAAGEHSGPVRAGGADDALTRELMGRWLGRAADIAQLLAAIEVLSAALAARPAQNVLCHGDAHTANIQIDHHGRVWLLDWEECVIAPRERDLMFVLDGVLATAPVTAEETSWFFAGYGPTNLDLDRLAYYRCSWAMDDLGGFATRVVDDHELPPAERAHALSLFRSLLLPTGIVDSALSSLRQLKARRNG